MKMNIIYTNLVSKCLEMLPNTKQRLLPSLGLILTLANAAYGQVSISGGSSANGPYTTLATAVTALNGATISGPVTVNVNAVEPKLPSKRLALDPAMNSDVSSV